MIASVGSDNALTLATPAVTSFTGGTYTIARQFLTLQSWENCISRSAANTCKRPADTQEYFPTTSSSLVADDRREVGIAYKESAFSKVDFNGSSTDAAHTITLTADPGNRHLGIAGAGVVVDGVAAALANVLVRGRLRHRRMARDQGRARRGDRVPEPLRFPRPHQQVRGALHARPQRAEGRDPDRRRHRHDRRLQQHRVPDGAPVRRAPSASAPRSPRARFASSTTPSTPTPARIVASGSNPGITLRNNLSLGNTTDYNVAGRNAASSNNLSTDLSGTTNSPAGGGLNNVIATREPPPCQLPQRHLRRLQQHHGHHRKPAPDRHGLHQSSARHGCGS